jgi:hypothetical protein
MADRDHTDFEAILQEQNELRRRLEALERRIERFAFPAADVAHATSTPEATIPTVAKTPPPPLPPAPVPEATAPIAAEVAAQPAPVLEAIAPMPVDAAPQPAPKPSWEFQLGTVWLVRVGIVILLTGVVFLGNYAYHHIVPHIGPGAKLALLYCFGGGLAWLGARFEKRSESLRNYGRVLLAGGAALVYYTTYGATFVDKLRVIESPLSGGVLLLGVGGLIVWLAEKRKQQSVALMAILLSYYTSAINPLGLFSLYSSLLLTLAAVYFVLRHRWTKIGFLSLVGTYGSYAYWRFYGGNQTLSFAEPVAGHVWQGIIFLSCYWILFTVAVFLSRSTSFSPEKRTPFLTFNNAAFFGLVFQILHGNHPHLTGRFSLFFGSILLLLAWVAKRRQNEDLFLDGAYLVQGLAVLTFGILTELNGYQLTLALTFQGTAMLFWMNRRHGWIYEVGAGLVTFLAFCLSIANNEWLTAGQSVGWSLTALLIGNAWLSRNFKKAERESILCLPAIFYCLLAIGKIGLFLPVHFTTVSTELLAAVTLIAFGMAVRLPELAITSQIFVLIAAVPYIFGSDSHGDGWMTVFGIIFIPLLLIHWWQRQKEYDPHRLGQSVFSILFLATATRWLFDYFPASEVGVYLGALAVATLMYGVSTRTQILAFLGQSLVFMAAGRFFMEAFFRNSSGSWPALHILFVAIDIGLLHKLGGRFSDRIKIGFAALQIILRAVLFAMLATWGWQYVDAPLQMLYFVGIATVLFFLAVRSEQKQPAVARPVLGYAAAFAVLGTLIFWNGLVQGQPASWWHVFSLLLLAIDERVGFKRLSLANFPASVRTIVISLVISGFFFEANRWLDLSHSAFPKTLAWALLGTISLCVGLYIRERAYRIGGLILLASAIVRIFIHDVWGVDPLFRILSFIVLGVVLLGLGFIYNKFADKFKEWL